MMLDFHQHDCRSWLTGQCIPDTPSTKHQDLDHDGLSKIGDDVRVGECLNLEIVSGRIRHIKSQ